MIRPEGHDPGRGETFRGVVLLVVAGIALGAGHNELARRSRPPRGLEWIAKPTVVQTLESLQPPATGDSPTGDSLGAPPAPGPSAPAVSAPPGGNLQPGAAGKTPAKPAASAAAPKGAVPDPKAPAPARRDSARASAAPAQTPPATPPPASARKPLPFIPDVPGPIAIGSSMLKQLYDADAALLLDAREADEYAEGHIAGARSFAYNDAVADPSRVQALDAGGRPIVIYCSGGACELSKDLAKLLVDAGKRKILIYEGGMPEWAQLGYPVARGPEPGARP